MIKGAHVIVYSRDADADRGFFRDVLGFRSVDAGDGWLIFALPPSEVAVHPSEQSRHELYLMCDNLEATTADLRRKGASISGRVIKQSWGRMVGIKLPGGSTVYMYEPHHASPLT